MPIEHIKVRNFRSLADVSVAASGLTVLVGCNDEGKSNLLRALDLFFNGGSRGYEFNWQKDFSGFAKVAKNKAPQIDVVLTFSLPTSFNVRQHVVWRRSWRQKGLHSDNIELLDGSSLPSRSKAYAYLKGIRYEYVPAIKGPEYFERLLSSVHDMLDATVRDDIRAAAASFTKEIRSHTGGILSELEQRLKLKSDLELPSDLKKLFSELEFRTTVGSSRVALSQRGDGIKVRHIPVILRWLADQANHLSAPGRPRVVTIWAYEEPENNLETRRGIELAEFFLNNSLEIQTFLTTHSPVFYSVLREPSPGSISLLEVKLDDKEGTQVNPRATGKASDVAALHSSIGFLDLLAPHVREWKDRVDRLEARVREGIETDHPTIFVEGPSDKTIIEAAIRCFFAYAKNVRVLCATQHGGGHSWVKDSLVAWHHSRPAARAVGLFDGDDASSPSIKEFQELVETRNNGRTRAFKHRLKADGIALRVVKGGFAALPVAIEELSPAKAWQKADREGWLEDRPNLTLLYGFSEVDRTFNEWLQDRLADPLEYMIARKRVQAEYKAKFAKYVAESLKNAACRSDFQAIEKLVSELLKKLDVHPPEQQD